MTVFGAIVLCLVLAVLYAAAVGTKRFFGLVYRKAGTLPCSCWRARSWLRR